MAQKGTTRVLTSQEVWAVHGLREVLCELLPERAEELKELSFSVLGPLLENLEIHLYAALTRPSFLIWYHSADKAFKHGSEVLWFPTEKELWEAMTRIFDIRPRSCQEFHLTLTAGQIASMRWEGYVTQRPEREPDNDDTEECDVCGTKYYDERRNSAE